MANNKVGDNRSCSVMSGGTVSNQGNKSLRLYSFSTSIGEEKVAIQTMLDSKQSHWSQMSKMLMVIAIPVISQIALCILNLARATSIQANVAEAQNGINTFFLIDNLVTNLQVERGTTATFLSSMGTDHNAFKRLGNIRKRSDSLLDRINDWPPEGLTISAMHYDNKLTFKNFIDSFRTEVDEQRVSLEYNILLYTNITHALMDWGQQAIVLPEKGNMWPLFVAQLSLMRASDDIGIQRALGSAFITLCEMSTEGLKWFAGLEGAARVSLSFAFGYHQGTQREYEDRFAESTLKKNILEQEQLISSPNFPQICSNFTDEERFVKSFAWFSNMTEYIVMIKNLRTHLAEEILDTLGKITQNQQVEVIMYSIILGIVTVICLSLALWYSSRLHNMLSKVTSYAKKVSAKSAELASEKKRSETLLYQMLPRAVAEQLKLKKEVAAEYYGQVTIMFSDIVGFTSMCAVSTPLQVVDMLNLLYRVFDASIDRYDVYKVETIGDAYMVVAGLPSPIEHHALEMAHLTLELMVSANGVKVPHMPDWHLQMRLGLHTGSCVAGVVGVKMPRYCLFGDTVNTASRMESTGIAKKIQISEGTYLALNAHGGFLVEPRGTVQIKGKGDMKTYFLIGCDGEPCHHNPHPIDGLLRRDSQLTLHSYKELKFQE